MFGSHVQESFAQAKFDSFLETNAFCQTLLDHKNQKKNENCFDPQNVLYPNIFENYARVVKTSESSYHLILQY